MMGIFRFCDLVWWMHPPFTFERFMAMLRGAPCFLVDDESVACLSFEAE